MRDPCRRKSRTPAAAFEPLEQRTLFYAWTAQEVYLSELINRARLNPQAEAARLGINLATGLTVGEQALLVSHEPLALNSILTQAARNHSLDMAARNFFDHINPDNLDPTARVHALGYAGTAGENIGAGYSDIDSLYFAWMQSTTQRKNILSLYTNFDQTFHYDEIGPGLLFGATGAAYSSYFTAEFGYQGSGPHNVYLLGVAFNDFDANHFYGIGEGAPGIRVDVAAASDPATTIATYATDAAGNYKFALGPGAYSITFTNIATGDRAIRQATIGADNVEVSIRTSDLQPLPDDHPNAGDWPSATGISTNPGSGSGASAGQIERGTDSDLFTFTATRTGLSRITLGPATNSPLLCLLRIFDGSHNLIATGAPLVAGGPDSVVTMSLHAGQQYFLLVSSFDAASLGDYALAVAGPDSTPLPLWSKAGSGQSISSFISGGRLVGAFLSSQGRPTFIQEGGGGGGVWTSIDLIDASVGGGGFAPSITGNLSCFLDPRDGVTCVMGRSDAGLILFTRSAGGAWSFRNLTVEIHGNPLVSNLSFFVDKGGGGHVQFSGLTAAGHLVTYRQTNARRSPGKWQWTYTDLFTRDLVRRGQSWPTLVGDTVSWITPGNTWNIAALDSAGHIHAFFKPGWNNRLWNTTDLSANVGVPVLTGNLTVCQSGDAAVHIAGTDSAGDVWDTSWRADRGWRTDDVTVITGAASLQPGSVSSYVNRGGVSFIGGLDASGRVILYRRTISGTDDVWRAVSLTDVLPPAGQVALSGSTSTCVGPVSGLVMMLGTKPDGQIIRMMCRSGQPWTVQNISQLIAA